MSGNSEIALPHVGFDDREHWGVTSIFCPEGFLFGLPTLVPFGAVLYLTSFQDREEVLECILLHLALPSVIEPLADTSSSETPVWSHHILFSQGFLESMRNFFSQWYFPIANNVHCYADGELLFWFHDAFTGGEMEISPTISEERVAEFCAKLAPPFRRIAAVDENCSFNGISYP